MINLFRRALRFALANDGGVKTRVVRSAVWVALTEIVMAITNFGRSIVLARLLTPETFGLMGLAGIAIRVIEAFTRPGIGQALIARRGEFEEARDTAFTLLAARGALLALVLALAAPLVAAFYDAEALEPVLTVLALTFVVGGLSNIELILQQKELDFRRISIFNQATVLVSTVVTIAAAYYWRNVWALVAGQIAASIISVVLSYVLLKGKPRFAWNGTVAGELLSYGKFVTGSAMVGFVATEIDSAVVGKVLGTESLGYYVMAFTIVHMATANVAKVASGIMMPAYSKLQDDLVAVKSGYLRTLGLMSFAVMPATAGLMLVAEPFIRLVYGEKWLPSVVPLQLLALFGLFRALAATSGYLFEGIGMPKIALKVAALRLAVVGPLIVPMVSHFGLNGAAVSVAAGMLAQVVMSHAYLHAVVRVTLRELFEACWQPLWTTGAMSLLLLVVGRFFVVNDIVGLAVTVAIGAVTYAALNVAPIRAMRNEMRRL